MTDQAAHAQHTQKLKKVLGVVLIVYGLFALFTPFTPGAWLALIGAEYLGVRLLFWEKLKAKLATPAGKTATIVASIAMGIFSATVLYTQFAGTVRQWLR